MNASLVTAGYRLADVGTDHGYIPIVLVQEGRIPSALAMDVNQGPLKRAEEHIKEYQLDSYIHIRLSDGVQNLQPGEADSVLIAGMGGALVIKILQEGKEVLKTVKELILQPQSEISKVRKYLHKQGLVIIDEDMVEEDGKFYPMMKVVHGEPEEYEEYINEGNFNLQSIQRSYASRGLILYCKSANSNSLIPNELNIIFPTFCIS